MEWISLHIFYEEEPSALIIDGIHPLLLTLIKNSSIDKYFFIRYSDKGPHIRLRVRMPYPTETLTYLQNELNIYLHNFPSKSSKNRPNKWYPNNSIQLIDYEPEVVRYGGVNAMAIAEDFFMYSSEVTISQLKRHFPIKIEKIHTMAIRLNCIFLYIFFEGDMRKIIDFLKISFLLTAKLLNINKKYNNFILNDIFSKNKIYFLKNIKDLLNNLANKSVFEEHEINIWISHAHHTRECLLAADTKDLIEYKKMGKALSPIEKMLPILNSYIHMTNNRIGVHFSDEILLNYILLRSFSEL